VGEKFGHDSIWENHLATQLWATDVEVTVVLDKQTMPLTQVLNLKVGDRLMLDAMPKSPVEVWCGEKPLFKAKVGRSRGRVAVQIDSRIVPKEI
jgi:flagellar motor switch protein FliM